MASRMSTKEKTVAVFLWVLAAIAVISAFVSIGRVFHNDMIRQKKACTELAKKLDATEWKTDDNGSNCRMVVKGELVEAGNL